MRGLNKKNAYFSDKFTSIFTVVIVVVVCLFHLIFGGFSEEISDRGKND